MEFTKQQKVEAYKKLSEQSKEFIMSDELAKTFQKIGSAHNLLLDKVNIMADMVILTLVGLVSSLEFPKKLSVALNMSGPALENLLEDINNKIFIPFRNSLQIEPDKTEKEVDETDGLNKESILTEIENPTPAVYPISIADQTIPGPAKSREIIDFSRKTEDSVAREFIEGKLTETVSLPSKKYTVDPYRETVN